MVFIFSFSGSWSTGQPNIIKLQPTAGLKDDVTAGIRHFQNAILQLAVRSLLKIFVSVWLCYISLRNCFSFHIDVCVQLHKNDANCCKGFGKREKTITANLKKYSKYLEIILVLSLLVNKVFLLAVLVG